MSTIMDHDDIGNRSIIFLEINFNFTYLLHITIKTESRYVANKNQSINNDKRTLQSPCRHINTKHMIIHLPDNGRSIHILETLSKNKRFET